MVSKSPLPSPPELVYLHPSLRCGGLVLGSVSGTLERVGPSMWTFHLSFKVI